MYKATYKAVQTTYLQMSLFSVIHHGSRWSEFNSENVFIFSTPACLAFMLRAVLDSCSSLQQAGIVFTQQSDTNEYPINPDPNKQLHCV